MIIETEINITGNASNIKHYKELGIILKVGDIKSIKSINLPKGSDKKILCSCDKCAKEIIIRFRLYVKYTKNFSEEYYCNSCSIIKTKKSVKDKYGVDNIFQLKETKDSIKENNLEKYGVEHYSSTEECKEKKKKTNLKNCGYITNLLSEDTKEKTKITLKEKYGVESPLQNKEIKNKMLDTIFLKYGKMSEYGKPYMNYVSEEEKTTIVEKMKKTTVNNKNNYYIKEFINLKNYTFLNYTSRNLEFKHETCMRVFTIPLSLFCNRKKTDLSLCTECYPISENVSIKEKEVVNWLKELNIDFIENDRTILNPKHLDVYIPSHKLAIEFNGLYWHSEHYKDKKYHLEKSIECQKQNIQLLHIWEDEWVYKQDIVKSIILNKLGKIEEKLYARQCVIKPIEDSKLVREFLDDNHIQGYTQSSIKLGLYYNNELVSLMTFGKRMIKKNVEFELIRFCNKINLNVVGAASKLFKYFKKNYEFTDLISYSDFRLFDGKMYEMLGFKKIHLSKPDYFWVKGLERKHRFNFNKQKLIKDGFDANKTENEIMWERGYYKIFGCGQYRWEFN